MPAVSSAVASRLSLIHERGEAVRQNGGEITEGLTHRREGAAMDRALFGTKFDFDGNFFGFVGEYFALSGFGVQFRLRVGEFFLNLQQSA